MIDQLRPFVAAWSTTAVICGENLTWIDTDKEDLKMRRMQWLSAGCLVLMLMLCSTAHASDLRSRKSSWAAARADRVGQITANKMQQLLNRLDESAWCAVEEHTRLDVDAYGATTTKEGKNVCVSFTREGDQLLIVVEWWNLDRDIYVMEYAIGVPSGRNQLEYIEVRHAPDSGFPGVSGRGTMTVYGSRLYMTQLGHLSDGTASGFSNSLVQVEAKPEIPIPLTFPPDE
ncbi:hypothetical protein MK280_11405 [Myxococcota bacterium]|nr:hypothetical protein [Myxococcota bacterium]